MNRTDLTDTSKLAASIGNVVNKQAGDVIGITVRQNAAQQSIKDEYLYTGTAWVMVGGSSPQALEIGQPFSVEVPRTSTSSWQ